MRCAHDNALQGPNRTNETTTNASRTPMAPAVCRVTTPRQKPSTASPTMASTLRAPIPARSGSDSIAELWNRASTMAAATTSAAPKAPSSAANPIMVSSFDQKTGPRLGTKVSQLQIEPELYSAPMKLAPIMKVTKETRTVDSSSDVLAASLNGVGSTLKSFSVGSGTVQSSAVPPVSRQSCSYFSWLSTQSLWDCW